MNGMNSPMPYIKDEPTEDFGFNSNGYNMNGMQSFSNNGQQYGTYNNNMHMDMSDMNAGGNLQRPNFGSQQNLSTSFIAGSSGIGDDELADLINYPDASESSGQQGDMGMHSGNVAQPQYGSIQGHSAIAMNQANQYVNNMYSQTPDGPGPIQSPFAHSFNYAQYMMQSQAQSPMQRPSHGMHQSFDMSTRLNSLRNTGSISKSHMTPKTAVSTGQGESPNSIAQAVQGSIGRGHQKTPSGQFVGGSAQSYTSPLSSPHAAQQSISMSSSRKESVASSAPASSLEAKRQKRRQSHNAVERRRRDNINDRISDLSHLVPGHRLEDDKIKKHVSSNNPFPPNLSGVSSMSPPQASSLLAGGTGRRAIGSISSAVPIDDKDKGPAKGDVLNGAVGWMRDLMWILHRKIQQESILLETIESLGGSNPLQIREDELRMQSELLDAIQRNGVSTFEYSRANGSGLWVPNHTDHSGAPLGQTPTPGGFHPNYQQQHQQFGQTGQDTQYWNYSNNDDLDFKEEDEFGMEIN